MGKKLDQVEKEAMDLSPADRAELAERLIATLDPGEDEDAEALWLEEAERRYQAYRAGKLGAKPADQVFAEAKKRLT